MRILGVLLQSKKGDPLVIASSPSLLTRTIILYSNMIYDNILQNYRRRQKIERCIVLQCNLQCVLTISKDYIFYVYIAKADLGIAFDAIKKVTEFFSANGLKIFQGAKTGAAKIQMISKKFVEFMSCFQEFLYTRELSLKEYLPLQPQRQSRKKEIDFEIFNKFSHVNQQSDKRIILDMSKSSSKVAAMEVKKRIKIVQHMKKFSIKNQDELDLLQTDPKKQQFLTNYRKNLINFARCGKPRNISLFTQKQISEKGLGSANSFFIEQQILEQTIMQKQRIKVKLMEKLELHLLQGKIKQVLQFGQILIQGTQEQTALINLLHPQTTWTNPKVLNKRISPNSVSIKQKSPVVYQFTTTVDYKSKPILDYIIRKQTFTQDKVPLLFVYTMQVSASNIQFIFKYKINDKWKQALTDIEICVYLNPEFMVSGDCITIPMAVSLRNQKIIWKTKQISQNNSPKGKIVLAFPSSNVSPKKIIKEIKLTMKCPNKGMLDNLTVECCQEDEQRSKAEKLLLISYKVQPND